MPSRVQKCQFRKSWYLILLKKCSCTKTLTEATAKTLFFFCIFSPSQFILIVSFIRQQIFFTFCVFTVPPGGLFWQLNKKNWQCHSTCLVKTSLFWKCHVIRTIFGDARALSNFCKYLSKCVSCLLFVNRQVLCTPEPFQRWFYFGIDLN
jgi:hypothetical protein